MPTESGNSTNTTSPTGQADTPANAWLLDEFKVGDFFFASPNTQYRARGNEGVLSSYKPATSASVQALFEQARQRGISDPQMFGLVPFDSTGAASMAIPLRYESGGIPAASAVSAGQPASSDAKPKIVRREPVPAPQEYGDMVRKALTLFAQGELKKVVLARAMDIELDRPLDYERLLPDLLIRNAHGYTFAVPIWANGEQAEPTGVMVGASPELLVRREGDRIYVNPLAGSIGRHSDPEIDRERREGLAVSEKDLREHGYVVKDIVRILREHCDELEVPDGPSV